MGYLIIINYDLKIIRYKHNGNIERKEIGAAWNELLSLKEFTEKGYNLLTDYREGIFKFPVDDLSIIDDYLEQIKPILKGKKNAVIVDSPNEYAASVIVGLNKDIEMDYYVEVFSTEQAALNFLKT